MAEVREMQRRGGDQVRLGERVQLPAVELGAEDRELVRAEVDVVLVDADARLVPEAGAAVAAGVRRVDLILGPEVGGVAAGVDGDVEVGRGVVESDEENLREPG